jgi:hypothetical protein
MRRPDERFRGKEQGLGVPEPFLVFGESMGKKKQKSNASQTMSYGYVPHQGTTDEAAYRASINDIDSQTPIVNAYGQMANDINDTTFEDQLPAGVAEKVKYGRMFDLNQSKAMMLSQAAGHDAQAKAGMRGSLAGMTQNPFVQLGGTTTGDVSTNNPFFYNLSGSAGDAIGGA